jgi:DNA-binding GntR family transcriptional regulator
MEACVTARKDITAPRPRYRQIADALRAEIRGGQYAIGTMLPTETELCGRFQASRHTIREALRLVEDAGLVARRQGSGTTIIAQDDAGRLVQDISRVGGLLQYPDETRLSVLRAQESVLDDESSALMNMPAGETWLRVEGIRRLHGTAPPICFTTLLLPPAFAAFVEEIGQEPGPVYALLERRFGLRLASVDVELSAGGVPAPQAALLEVEAGAPALMIRRRYIDATGRVFEVSHSCHPAPRFHYRATLRREL